MKFMISVFTCFLIVGFCATLPARTVGKRKSSLTRSGAGSFTVCVVDENGWSPLFLKAGSKSWSTGKAKGVIEKVDSKVGALVDGMLPINVKWCPGGGSIMGCRNQKKPEMFAIIYAGPGDKITFSGNQTVSMTVGKCK